MNPERVAPQLTLSGLKELLIRHPGLSLRSNPGLTLANAVGVSALSGNKAGFGVFNILGALTRCYRQEEKDRVR